MPRRIAIVDNSTTDTPDPTAIHEDLGDFENRASRERPAAAD
jgi:hypothetical protein